MGYTEDHIAALADVMRMLILGSGGEAAADLSVQRRFFERFIRPWYSRLAQDMTAEPALFYRAVGRFFKAFLDVEKTSFEMA